MGAYMRRNISITEFEADLARVLAIFPRLADRAISLAEFVETPILIVSKYYSVHDPLWTESQLCPGKAWLRLHQASIRSRSDPYRATPRG
jgi:hypothetical protein